MAVFNEESVIAKKIESIISNKKSYQNFNLLIGSDNSTDNTNTIIERYCLKYPFIIFLNHNERKGKAQIINELVSLSDSKILILTDANVIFTENLIFNLTQSFQNEKIGLVDSKIINTGIDKNGISFQESTYLDIEKKIKDIEGRVFGRMIGPFGGCYAIRKNLYTQVPINFLVDDFYINMNILLKGFKTITNSNAIVYEDVSNNLREEFRRKIRISTGNFQNLQFFFFKLIKIDLITFILFFSHKILRWLTPIFIVIIIPFFFVKYTNQNNLYIGYILLFLFISPLIDFMLKRININLLLFRFATHFLSMNLALLIGFLNYLKGVKTNVWQPTKRNQKVNFEVKHN